MNQQMSIDDAIAAGTHGMTVCLDKAEEGDPQFSEKAAAAIVAHLRVVGQCSGEVLTDVARARKARLLKTTGPLVASSSACSLAASFTLSVTARAAKGTAAWGQRFMHSCTERLTLLEAA